MKFRHVGAIGVLGSAAIAISCSSGPQPAKVGTPGYYWSAAKETYASGDYVKAVQHLGNLIKTDNEFTKRAQPWYLVLTAGMGKGYIELADNYESGAKANRYKATQFRKPMNEYRALASALALQYAEAFEKFEAGNTDPTVALDFAYPPGNANPSPALTRVGKGEILQPKAADDLRREHLQTALIKVTCSASGAGEDQAKAQELFKQPPVQVPKATFMLAMVRLLHDNANLYSRKKLDDPKRAEFFAGHALDALKTVPESKETKDLAAKIQKTLKLVKASQ